MLMCHIISVECSAYRNTYAPQQTDRKKEISSSFLFCFFAIVCQCNNIRVSDRPNRSVNQRLYLLAIIQFETHFGRSISIVSFALLSRNSNRIVMHLTNGGVRTCAVSFSSHNCNTMFPFNFRTFTKPFTTKSTMVLDKFHAVWLQSHKPYDYGIHMMRVRSAYDPKLRNGYG